MTDRQMNNRVAKLQDLENQYKELEKSIELLKDELKAALAENGEEVHDTGSYLIKYQSIVSNKLDSTALKKDLPDVYSKYTKESSYKRFTVKAS